MAQIIIKQIENKKEWEEFLALHEEANFLQSWYWGEFHEKLGKYISRVGVYKNNKLVGVMQSVVESARRGRYLTVPAGPIIDWRDSHVIDHIFSEMKNIARANNCSFIRVRPQLVSDDFSRNIFKKHGFIGAPMYLHAELTSQLDIAKSEEQLLADMRKTTRYEIKKAGTLGVKVEQTKDEDHIKEFYDLQIETAKRQKFTPFSYRFFKEQFEIFFDADKALLYNATLNGKILAQAFIIFYGKEAVYHYGASTEEGRKYPGAYLLQWEAIKEAKRRGMSRYNFWGVAPEHDAHHRFSGISVFKRGFGGNDIQYLHAQDLIVNYPLYAIDYVIETVRKLIRRV